MLNINFLFHFSFEMAIYMRFLEAERLKRYERILEMKKQIEEEERNAIDKDKEP
jgi:hypothetical protein